MNPRIGKLSSAEETWIANQRDAAVKFVNTYASGNLNMPISLKRLDEAFTAWMALAETDTDRINSVINCVGITYGSFLVNDLDLTWVIATDKYGSDLAVYGTPDKGEVLIYPANFVAKRWERRETNFLEQSYQQTAEQIARIQAFPQQASKKPWWRIW